ncbi:hypothetical protein AJ78_05175 [Emergomyces pasteurianus Ep9510]|uniref:Protein kinase domain-containing protein n=1 Tax=Emergomyces pasteurianus Ep9510 TaxID=1447872 RepID=A0A1J9Q2R4_9EURO|nr:hypothetical protein AJ78_05175 [Emergomyces pasteurianus Ep9510]
MPDKDEIRELTVNFTLQESSSWAPKMCNDVAAISKLPTAWPLGESKPPSHPACPSFPHPAPTLYYVVVSEELEDEKLPNYNPTNYHPAHLGQVEGRYQIIGKLGYGVTSTLWLGRDLLSWKKYLQSKNLLLQIDNTRVFKIFEETELREPAPRKVLENHTIYMTRRIPGTETLPIITDFGESRLINETRKEESIMPDVYRAPEAILWMEWNDKVDIWNVAAPFQIAICPLGEMKKVQLTNHFVLRKCFAEMVAIMSPPPQEFLNRSEACKVFWDENGRWRNFAPLETLAAGIQGDDKNGFLNFLRKTLRCLPEERAHGGRTCLR